MVNTFSINGCWTAFVLDTLEMPGMKLRIEQCSACVESTTMCRLVLDALVRAKFLSLKSDGTYVRLTEGSSPRSRPVKAALTLTTPIVMTARRAS